MQRDIRDLREDIADAFDRNGRDKSDDVEVPAGALVTVRLERPVDIPAPRSGTRPRPIRKQYWRPAARGARL